MSKSDIYNLNFSQNFDITGSEEQDINIDLQTAQVGTCSVTGTVVDENQMPVPGCTIKLFDNNGKPFMHTVTNELGTYTFADLASGNYFITCVKDDLTLTVAENIYLQENEIKTFNFKVTLNLTVKPCTVSGLVLKYGEDNKPIDGATVRLLNALTGETVATTASASDGEYVFYDIVAGEYRMVATKQGYDASSEINITAKDNTILNVNLKLNINPIESLGTVSGVISHKGIFVTNAFVGLYKIDENNREVLVATTKTNQAGAYMFGKVESGKYKVKAKLNN